VNRKNEQDGKRTKKKEEKDTQTNNFKRANKLKKCLASYPSISQAMNRHNKSNVQEYST
jgi:hypothetical protein